MTVFEQLKQEQDRNRDLMRVIWVLVRKAGGTVRLSDFDRVSLEENWQLVEFLDMATCEVVMIARIPKSNPNSTLP